MPGVICGSCGKGTNVSFRRGTRLADIGCPSCGKANLHLRSAGQPNRHKGRKYVNCVACGRRNLHPRYPEFAWQEKYGRDVTYPAGSPCCRYGHEPVPAARTRHDTVHRELTDLLGRRDNWATDAECDALEEAAIGRPPARGECPVCKPWQEQGMYGGWAYHVDGYAFERGTALVASCDWCGNTILLATLAREAVS
jgi:hypothetical protein